METNRQQQPDYINLVNKWPWAPWYLKDAITRWIGNTGIWDRLHWLMSSWNKWLREFLDGLPRSEFLSDSAVRALCQQSSNNVRWLLH